ncbi:N-acyl homoserine lactonase family protein [Jannaschia sp. Os4]|uniref:MBL fold metallo-hydrolase n=1 Tax=Jannaschia sp. Os4 TaxID=2807617 RepID=UPI00193A0235|nr:N-acyl homoserine lactonase family protein [Jannaschia sp. Os4]
MIWQVEALRYGTRAGGRTRSDSFLFDDHADTPHAIDYFVWLLRSGDRTILVDTGYDAEEGRARGRPIDLDPREALSRRGVAVEDVEDVIVTHLHYDHAGGLHLFPGARLHLQPAEMAYATGPCMCHDALRHPFTGAHVCEAVTRLYAGKVVFHEGAGQIADGVEVHRIGGHSKGLQCVRVRTEAGWLVLASDATHFYENVHAGKLFPIVVDAEAMLRGFDTLRALASAPDLIVPGHDPLVRDLFPEVGPEAWRLDRGPSKPVPGL